MMRPLPIAASLALLLAASAVTAQDPAATPDTAASAQVAAAIPAPAPATPTGDAARGRGLTYTCRGCHGVSGYKNAYPSYRVPKLGGQSETYLYNSLIEYREDKRKHPTMQAQARSLSEQDLADIATYLASIK